MKKLITDRLPKEHFKKMVDIFGREATWDMLYKAHHVEEMGTNTLLNFMYCSLMESKYRVVSSLLNLNGKNSEAKHISWLSFTFKDCNPALYTTINEKSYGIDLEFFIKEMGSVEWEDKLSEDFEDSEIIKHIIKVISEHNIDYITTHKGDIDSAKASKWRDAHLFNEAEMISMIDMADFNLKYNPVTLKFSLYDRQRGNLGGIEGEVFRSVEEAFERMEVYFIDLFDEESDD